MFSWSVCDKNCHIIRSIKSDNFLGYVAIHKSWEDNISEEEQWVKINTDRKRLLYNENDGSEKSYKYCSIGNREGELNIDPVSTKNAQMRERWCHDHKTWTSGN
jgi:hypothetical protein